MLFVVALQFSFWFPWLLMAMAVIGLLIMSILYGRDITSQKANKKRLEQLSKVASGTENVVVIMNGNGNFEWVNRGFEVRYGGTMKEFVDKNGVNLRENSSNENIVEILEQINNTRKPYTYSSRTLDTEGNDVWYQTNITPILAEDGEISSLFLIDSDITGLKKADLQIKQQKYKLESQRDQLRKLNARKDRLFSIIAHDLKNPFQSIIGFSDLLKDDYKNLEDIQVQEYLELIHSSSTSAYDLLFNLLEWARAQIKIIKIDPVTIGIADLISEIIELLSLQAKNKQIQFENRIDPGLEVYTDQRMLHTILRNLVNNAIKFTGERGQVTFSAIKQNGFVDISIKDSGVGIPEDKIKALFSFEKSKSTAGTAGETGTGLGLLVCQEFLILNNGKIRVTSLPGAGSTFIITLPSPV
ncbi:MAG: PAS domain-containing sensor histidine kinase [Bacteroidales bacterium]|nr:PAS domain-containing sensor histidine kinase [Bacteroidales bacterium]